MPNLAVIHPDLEMKGGAEDVCMHVLEALQNDHDVTLFTLVDPNIGELNEYFETSVRKPTTRLISRTGTELNRRAENSLVQLQAALLGRAVEQYCDEFDLLISTKNEFAFGRKSVQYVHSPQFMSADPGLGSSGLVKRAYDQLCRSLAGINPSDIRSNVLLANSNWTANIVEQTYGGTARTVYPPVNCSKYSKRKWSEREQGFLTIGRIGPSKNVLRNIDVIAKLRERGHNVHLHIVGPTTDDDYCERVERRAAEHEFIHFEGAVEYEELTRLITAHRYGLHGRPYEHFGIVVAEMAAGGALPFAPNSGGQREILNENPHLLYESVDDAVEKMDRVLSSPELAQTLRGEIASTVERFDRPQFKETVRDVISEAISGASPQMNAR